LLWNGEYYGQTTRGDAFDFGSGCLADQLLGQWWAHQLDLGHILPAAHVRTALDSIVRYNLRETFRGFRHGYRVFADGDDAGLLVCTWPHDGRPAVPIRYADEVWTGVEYQVAAHCMFEGMTDTGLRLLRALRGRYDGSRRNPWNEIECGDHYARAMAGFSVLGAYTGARYDASTGHLRIGRGADRYPLLAATAWGEALSSESAASFRVLGGRLQLDYLSVAGVQITAVSLDGEAVPAEAEPGSQRTRLGPPLHLSEGQTLAVTFARDAG
jgi:non-lysosomal glucosylceramidase